MGNLRLQKPISDKDQYIDIMRLQGLHIKSNINTLSLMILYCNIYKISIHHNQILISILLQLFCKTICQRLLISLFLILFILIIYLISFIQLFILLLEQLQFDLI